MIEGTPTGLVVGTATTTTDGPISATVLWILGEVDLASRDTFADAVDRAMSGTNRSVIIDVSAMAFCDAAGLAILMRATHRAIEAGSDLALVALSPRLATLCCRLWPGPQPAHFPTVDAALAVGPLSATRTVTV